MRKIARVVRINFVANMLKLTAIELTNDAFNIDY